MFYRSRVLWVMGYCGYVMKVPAYQVDGQLRLVWAIRGYKGSWVIKSTGYEGFDCVIVSTLLIDTSTFQCKVQSLSSFRHSIFVLERGPQ